jgi:hypothetical protein
VIVSKEMDQAPDKRGSMPNLVGREFLFPSSLSRPSKLSSLGLLTQITMVLNQKIAFSLFTLARIWRRPSLFGFHIKIHQALKSQSVEFRKVRHLVHFHFRHSLMNFITANVTSWTTTKLTVKQTAITPRNGLLLARLLGIVWKIN